MMWAVDQKLTIDLVRPIYNTNRLGASMREIAHDTYLANRSSQRVNTKHVSSAL